MWGEILGSVAGNVLGGLLGNKGQESANEASAQSAQKMMDFQERMSNTSYQRGMSDMKKAGLNPMLAFMKGGASTPSGTQYTAQNEMAPLASGIKEIAPQVVQMQNIQSSTAKNTADATLSAANADVANATAAEIRARTPVHASTISLNDANIRHLDASVSKLFADIDLTGYQEDKISAEIQQLAREGNLTNANVNKVLSETNLTNEQIKEVQPRISEILAHASNLRAEHGLLQLKGDVADDVNASNHWFRSTSKELPKTISDIWDRVTNSAYEYGRRHNPQHFNK